MEIRLSSQHMVNVEINDKNKKARKLTPKINFITNNIKNSVRGSDISS